MKLITRNVPYKSDDSHTLYDITTNLGLTVSILDLGTSKLKKANVTPDRTPCYIALGSPELSFYENCSCYAGATLAPNAGRIRGSHLPVNGEDFKLSANDQKNQLHGGSHNLSAALWDTDSVTCTHDTATVTLSAFQPDGTDGYPGNRRYQVRYYLEDTNWLTVEYSAWTDRPTYINMSGHTYWNLTGDFTKPCTGQVLTIFSNNVCINDAEHLPVDIIPVAGTVFDFRDGKPLQTAGLADFESRQLEIACGYNHAFLLNRSQPFRTLRNIRRPQLLKRAAVLTDPDSGHTMKMLTDAPALVLYSGGFLPDEIKLHGGQLSCASCAVALEAQDVPDVMHLIPGSCVLTTPEHPFHRVIRYHVI